ncbi:MAG: GGDEF domain-containing protein [Actinobacteria bacterium]|nr:GGDEF domain-containing protein [Actinomycetota bacterium]
MRFSEVIAHMDVPTRIMASARLLASVVLFLVPFPIAAVGLRIPFAYMLGTTIFAAWTLVWVVRTVRAPEGPLVAMLTATAVVDAVALCLLTQATYEFRDPFFAWYMAEAASFSVMLKRRHAWLLGGLLGFSYFAGHVLGAHMMGSLEYIFVVLNVGVLMAVSFAVALVLGGHEQRRAAAETHRAEVLKLNDQLERSVAELRALTEITELIHSTLEVENVGPTLLDILEKVINIPAGSLYVIDKSKQETIFTASSVVGAASARAYSGLELAGTVSSGNADGALSCIELVDHNQTVVVFCAETEAVESLQPDDRIVLQAVASELVVAVENSRLYRLTKRLAITDELTDLHNYRYLQQRLDEEIGRAARYNKRLSLLMLDIDDFKHVNDTQGHLVGDAVLAEVAQVLKSTVREVDVVARYGGEEFTIILPETDASGAFIVAEKIREAISMHRFPDADGGRRVHLTVSIGLASYPVHAPDKESLLRSADDAVYHAKETGKDRVRAPRLRLRRLPAQSEEVGG